MAINSTSPTTFESGVLIADTVNISGGARGVINETITPSAALDIQSISGAFLPPRMTTLQRLSLNPSDGMIVYDTTLDQFQLYEAGAWTAIGTNAGNVRGPNISVLNNIAVFADTTGKVIADSGVNISAVPVASFLEKSPLAVDIQLSGVDILSYNDVGLIYTGGNFVVGFHPNTFVGRPPNTVFGFSNPSSPDATVEITQGSILLSRLTQTQINSLIATDGMVLYNEDTDKFNFYQNGSWTTFGSGNSNAKYIIQTTDSSLPNAQVLGTLANGLLKNTTTTGILSTAIDGTDYYSPNSLSGLTTGLVKVTNGTGVLSTAAAGTDYYSPGNPTTIIDTTQLNGNFSIGSNINFGISSNNVFIATGATDNITGVNNCFISNSSGFSILSGSNNTGLGYNALGGITTTGTNTGVGSGAGGASGFTACTYIGYSSGAANTGDQCTAVGAYALDNTTNSANDTAIGDNALTDYTGSGGNNTAVGQGAGGFKSAYTQCTFLGQGTDATVSGLTNATAIGWGAAVSTSNSMVLGNGVNVGIGTSSPLYPLHISNVNNFSSLSIDNSTSLPSTNSSGTVLYSSSGSLFLINGDGTTVNLSAFTPAPIVDKGTTISSIYVGSNTANSPGITATNNTFVGDNVCPSLSFGNGTTAIGSKVLTSAALPLRVTAIGLNSMASYTNPGDTVAIGVNSGNINSNTGCTNCVFIGNGSDASTNGLTNAIAIGYNSRISINNGLALGAPAGQGEVKVAIATDTPVYNIHLATSSVNEAYFFIGNSTSAPSTPSGGGVLFVQSGALKYKGSSGTVTNIANA